MFENSTDIALKITTLLFIIIGWLIAIKTQKHFYQKNKRKDVINTLIDLTNNMLEHGIKFWIDENHKSCQADQERIINIHRRIRSIIDKNKKCLQNHIEIIDSSNQIKKTLTNTPHHIKDFSKIEKPTRYSSKINESRELLDKITNLLH